MLNDLQIMFWADHIFVSEKEIFAQMSPSLCLKLPLAPPSVHTPAPFPALFFSLMSPQINTGRKIRITLGREIRHILHIYILYINVTNHVYRDGLPAGHCLRGHFRSRGKRCDVVIKVGPRHLSHQLCLLAEEGFCQINGSWKLA